MRTVHDPVLDRMITEVFGNIQAVEDKQRRKDAAENPEKYRDSTQFEDLRWLCWTKGKVQYCYSTTRNIGGYYLAFQYVQKKKGEFTLVRPRGYKLRRDAKESAWTHYERGA